MARHFSTWRLANTAVVIIVANLWGAPAALGQYAFVQDTDGAGNWDDSANWGTTPPDYPDAPGATVVFNQLVRSGGGAYTMSLPASPDKIIVGSLTVNNTGVNPGNLNINNGELVFQSANTTDVATYIETASTAPNGPGRTTINSAITLLSDLELTQSNISGLNTGTIFAGLINGDSAKTITKKGANANLQLNYGFALAADEGFKGKFVIEEGGIRVINTPTIEKSTGITVLSGGQFQIGWNGANSIDNWKIADNAVLTLNGNGKGSGNNASGAFRLQLNPATSPGATMHFNSLVTLQTDSRIEVQPTATTQATQPNTGILTQKVSGPGDLIKTGPGTLVLESADNDYSGDTNVMAGILSIMNPNLANGADVYLPELATTATLNLTFDATDTVRSLFFNGAAQVTGTWGALGNANALNHTDLITGLGVLNVTTFPVLGDFNSDGVVDAADYVVWRNSVGPGNLPNDGGTSPDVVDDADYNFWAAHFGNPLGSSSGGEFAGLAAVPEPNTALLAVFALCGLLAIAIRR